MLKEINIRIKGMNCESCKSLIEMTLKDLKGVKKVDVNHQTGESNIEFNDEDVSQDQIFKEIEKLNYTVEK